MSIATACSLKMGNKTFRHTLDALRVPDQQVGVQQQAQTARHKSKSVDLRGHRSFDGPDLDHWFTSLGNDKSLTFCRLVD